MPASSVHVSLCYGGVFTNVKYVLSLTDVVCVWGWHSKEMMFFSRAAIPPVSSPGLKLLLVCALSA